MNWIKNRIEEKREEKKQADLERLAQLIESEYQLAQIEADILERQFDPDAPLVQCALKLRDAFGAWQEKYGDVLAAHDEFEAEKARYEAKRRSGILSGSVFKKGLGR